MRRRSKKSLWQSQLSVIKLPCVKVALNKVFQVSFQICTCQRWVILAAKKLFLFDCENCTIPFTAGFKYLVMIKNKDAPIGYYYRVYMPTDQLCWTALSGDERENKFSIVRAYVLLGQRPIGFKHNMRGGAAVGGWHSKVFGMWERLLVPARGAAYQV